MTFLFPLADLVEPLRRGSPWCWALGHQPVTDGVSWSRLALLLAVTAGLVAIGPVAVGRRDLRSA